MFAAYEGRNFAGVEPVDKNPETYVRGRSVPAGQSCGPVRRRAT